MLVPVVTDPAWTPEVFVDDNGYEPFTSFIESVPDFTFVALDAAIRLVLSVRGLELARTQWLKALGDGLYQFRVRHDAEEIARMFGDDEALAVATGVSRPGPVLLRVFVHFHGDKVILLLSGYDKGDDPSKKRQEREIAAARKYLRVWKQQESKKKAAERRGGGNRPPSGRKRR